MPPPYDPRTRPGLTALALLAAAFGAAYLFVSSAADTANAAPEEGSEEQSMQTSLDPFNLNFDYFVERSLDTLYVLDTCFLEVRLDSQYIIQHCRSGNDRRFPCSTGNKKINKAIETTDGIFCVQSKSPLAYSRQFDSTKMYFWVGFNGNIGFHGLDGKGYYRYLGHRPSSHGCIRMAREDAEWMFKNIPISTPVIVHYGTGARCLAFADSMPPTAIRLQPESWIRRDMERQLRSWYRGRGFIDGARLHYFQKSSLWWGGIPTGELSRVPARQIRPAYPSSRSGGINDVLTYAFR